MAMFFRVSSSDLDIDLLRCFEEARRSDSIAQNESHTPTIPSSTSSDAIIVKVPQGGQTRRPVFPEDITARIASFVPRKHLSGAVSAMAHAGKAMSVPPAQVLYRLYSKNIVWQWIQEQGLNEHQEESLNAALDKSLAHSFDFRSHLDHLCTATFDFFTSHNIQLKVPDGKFSGSNDHEILEKLAVAISISEIGFFYVPSFVQFCMDRGLSAFYAHHFRSVPWDHWVPPFLSKWRSKAAGIADVAKARRMLRDLDRFGISLFEVVAVDFQRAKELTQEIREIVDILKVKYPSLKIPGPIKMRLFLASLEARCYNCAVGTLVFFSGVASFILFVMSILDKTSDKNRQCPSLVCFDGVRSIAHKEGNSIIFSTFQKYSQRSYGIESNIVGFEGSNIVSYQTRLSQCQCPSFRDSVATALLASSSSILCVVIPIFVALGRYLQGRLRTRW